MLDTMHDMDAQIKALQEENRRLKAYDGVWVAIATTVMQAAGYSADALENVFAIAKREAEKMIADQEPPKP